MKAFLTKYSPCLLSLLLGVSAFLFWYFRYPQALAYQEQLQLFLFDGEYLADRMSAPGGIARYLAEFLVQFDNNLAAGSIILALLYVLLQVLTWLLMRRENGSRSWYSLSFLPSLMLWFYMGDENVKLTYVVALLLAMVAAVAYPYRRSPLFRSLYLLIVLPLLHWVAGPVVLMLGLYATWQEALRHQHYPLSLFSALFSVASILLCAPFVPYPLYRLFYGINYNLVIPEISLMQCFIMAVCVLLPLLMHFLPDLEGKKARTVATVSTATLALAGIFGIPSAFNDATYDILRYDLLVRSQQWDKIVAIAEKKQPDLPLSVASLNLALGMRGELNNRGMQFYQNGWQGAFPSFNKNFESSIVTAEIYYQLGLVNTAQRLDFEAMEAIPDNNKSARLVKRLAETNLINGQYAVARKYLKILQKTLFYKKWAEQTLPLLGDEDAINQHPTYGRMRQLRLTRDFLFSEQELDKIMGQLVMQNKDNYLAIQYLLFLPVLEGDQQKLMMYRDFVQRVMQPQEPNPNPDEGGETHEQ